MNPFCLNSTTFFQYEIVANYLVGTYNLIGDKMNYIKKTATGIMICEARTYTEINSSLIRYLDNICIENYSSLKGRTKAIKKLFGFIQNTPILVSDNILLLPTKSIRLLDVILVNWRQVIHVVNHKELAKIQFKDGTNITLDVTYKRFLKEMKKAEVIESKLGIIM